MKARVQQFLWFAGLVALVSLAPVHRQVWSYETARLEVANPNLNTEIAAPVMSADLDGDGSAERLALEAGQAALYTGQALRWQSPPGWQVTQAAMTDLNRDGAQEVTLLVWRAFRPWPIDRFLPYGGRIEDFQNGQGRSCHLILIGWKEGGFREVWAGSALAQPVLAFTAADLDGDGRQELATLDGSYNSLPASRARTLSVWEWNGFGFTVLARVEGAFKNLNLVANPNEGYLLVTQE